MLKNELCLNDIPSKYICEASLYEFFKQAWPSMEGKTPFIDNGHLKIIAEHLEACYRREIKNLLINTATLSFKFFFSLVNIKLFTFFTTK